jgi:acyl dehydratase
MSPYERLASLIGSELGVSDWFEITQERIDAFADATEDHQWIHVDRERASAGPFGRPIAHGFLTLSLLPFLSGQIPLPVEQPKMGINYGLDKVRFIAPVPVGSNVRARAVLSEVTEIPRGVQVKRTVTVEVEGSEKPACVAETISRLLW